MRFGQKSTQACLSVALVASVALGACGGGNTVSPGNFSPADLGKPCANENEQTGLPDGTAVCGRDGAGGLVWQRFDPTPVDKGSGQAAATTVETTTTLDPSIPTSWYWDDASQTYKATGAAPECPVPLIGAGELVDLGKVKSFLVPGQVRDGEYLVNGTFRWSSAGQPFPNIAVTMPFDGYVTASWQFLKSGSYLFGLNLVHPCGLMVRISKMGTPSPDIKATILDPMGSATERGSQETFYKPGFWLTKGTPLASTVGIAPPNKSPDVVGAQFDVAILDLRAKNPQIPADFDFAKWSGSAAPQYVWYAHCFFQGDYIAESDKVLIQKLPLLNNDPRSDTCTSS